MGADAPGIDPALTARDVVSFVIDSREIQAGDVFFALSQPEYKENGFNGDFDDATGYVKASLENGAIAAVIRRDRFEQHIAELGDYENRLIFVDDAISALQRLAHHVYVDWNKPVVAITGSAGKTTAKELTAHVLESSGRKVLRNIKNYNNGLGHPLTVLNLAKDPSYDIAVLEMGMSTPLNEIARLCRITPPDVSVVLNVLPVHVEHLGSIENVAAATSKGSVLAYGIENPADVTAADIEFAGFGMTAFTLKTPSGSARASYPLNGRHNILNALAAAAVGHGFGMTAAQIAECLRSVAPPPQRGEVLRFADGFTVINDSYNSNPAALLSMVETLVDGSEGAKRRIVVAGEMLELGDDAERLHEETGEAIANRKVDMLVGVRGFGEQLVSGAKRGGLEKAVFAVDSDSAGELLVGEVREGDVILVKGSRGVRTEKVIEKLLEKFEPERSAAVQL